MFEFLSTLSADERAAIEGRVKAEYMLSDEQREQFRYQLADEQARPSDADITVFDVAKSGFKT